MPKVSFSARNEELVPPRIVTSPNNRRPDALQRNPRDSVFSFLPVFTIKGKTKFIFVPNEAATGPLSSRKSGSTLKRTDTSWMEVE